MTRSKQFETLIVIMLALIVAYWLTGYRYLLTFSFIMGLAGLLISQAREAIHWLWMKFSMIVGFISNRILLTVIFVVILIPLSFLRKLFGNSVIDLKPGKLTYFRNRMHKYTKDDLENPW